MTHLFVRIVASVLLYASAGLAGVVAQQNVADSVEGYVQKDCKPTDAPNWSYRGTPAPSSTIKLIPRNGGRIVFGSTRKDDQEGYFLMQDVPVADYDIHVVYENYEIAATLEGQTPQKKPWVSVISNTRNKITDPRPICLSPKAPLQTSFSGDDAVTGSAPTGPESEDPNGNPRIQLEPQSEIIAVTGEVRAEGSAVRGARVVLYHDNRNAAVQLGETRTDKDGTFSLILPKPDSDDPINSTYYLLVSGRGYAPGTSLLTLGIDASVELEPETEPVRLETSEATHRNVLSPRLLQSLPLGGVRNFDGLALLYPGVLPAPQTASQTGPGIAPGIGTAGSFSVNGMRSRENNFTSDGSDNNDEDVGTRRQGYVLSIPQSIESVQEVQFITLLGDARYVRNIGAHVNVLSRSGGPEFHGVVYGFFTHEALNARSFFSGTAASRPGTRLMLDGALTLFQANVPSKDRNRRVQSGFLLSGPIGRHNFLSVSLEVQNLGGAQTHHFAVPAAEQRSLFAAGFGDALSRPQNMYAASLPGNAVFSLYPFPNNPDGPYGANTYTSVLEANSDSGLLALKYNGRFRTGRLNHTLSLTANSTFESSNVPTPGSGLASLQPRVTYVNPSLIVNTTISDRIANTFRGSFGSTFGRFPAGPALDAPLLLNLGTSASEIPEYVTAATPRGQALLQPLGVTGTSAASITGNLGRIAIAGFTAIGQDQRFPQTRQQHTWQWADNLNWLINRRRTVMLGFDLRRVGLQNQVPAVLRPLAEFSGVATSAGSRLDPLQMAAAGIPTLLTLSGSTQPETDGLISGFTHKSQLEIYAQHTWRIGERFTANIGGRVGLNRLPKTVDDRFRSVVQSLGTSFIKDRAQNDLRAGFAWDTGNQGIAGHTVLRGGFGTYTGQFPLVILNESRGTRADLVAFNYATPPAVVDERFLVHPANGAVTIPSLEILDPVPQIYGPAQGFKVPYAYHYSVAAETEWPGRLVSSVSYTGTQGRKLLRISTPQLGPRRSLLEFGGIRGMTGAPLLPVVEGRVVAAQAGTPAFHTFAGDQNSFYSSMQAELRKHYSRGLLFGTAFTWSHAFDTVSDFFETAGAFALPQNSTLPSERAAAGFDARLRFVTHFVWDIAPQARGWKSGWQLAGIYSAQSGQPYTVNTVFDVNKDGNTTDRLNNAALVNRDVTDGGRVRVRVPAGVYTSGLIAAPGQDGHEGRNTFVGAGINNLDFSVSKRLAAGETGEVLLRSEFFNLFNRTHFALPVRILESPGFGTSVQTTIPARTIQFAAKFMF